MSQLENAIVAKIPARGDVYNQFMRAIKQDKDLEAKVVACGENQKRNRNLRIEWVKNQLQDRKTQFAKTRELTEEEWTAGRWMTLYCLRKLKGKDTQENIVATCMERGPKWITYDNFRGKVVLRYVEEDKEAMAPGPQSGARRMNHVGADIALIAGRPQSVKLLADHKEYNSLVALSVKLLAFHNKVKSAYDKMLSASEEEGTAWEWLASGTSIAKRSKKTLQTANDELERAVSPFMSDLILNGGDQAAIKKMELPKKDILKQMRDMVENMSKKDGPISNLDEKINQVKSIHEMMIDPNGWWHAHSHAMSQFSRV